jgi:hypothetical protein
LPGPLFVLVVVDSSGFCLELPKTGGVEHDDDHDDDRRRRQSP